MLVLSLGALAGVAGLAELVLAPVGMAGRDETIVALVPFLAWPVTARRWGHAVGWHVSGFPAGGVFWEALLLAVVLGVVAGLARRGGVGLARRGVQAAGVVGWAVLGVGVASLAILLHPPGDGAWMMLATMLGVVLACLVAQAVSSRMISGEAWRAWGSAPALVVAGSQLVDGVVSYLAVANPLGVLAGGFEEAVPLSAFLIDHAGPGFALVKWGVALGFVYALDVAGGARESGGVARLGAYLLVALLGVVPSVFSSTQVLI